MVIRRTICYLLLMLASGQTLFAQELVYDVSPVFNLVGPEMGEGIGFAFITNTADTRRNFRWDLTVVEMTDTWDVTFCDKNQCYNTIVTTEEFFLEADSSGRMDVHVYTNLPPVLIWCV